MIKNPKVGENVIIVSSKSYYGADVKAGDIGTIVEIRGQKIDSTVVVRVNDCNWWLGRTKISRPRKKLG